MSAAKDPRLTEALRLARAGDKPHARDLLMAILRQDRDNFDAWVIMSQVAESQQEAVSCAKQALRVRPNDERAKRYLDHLLQDEQSDDEDRTSPWLWIGLGTALIALLIVGGIFVASRFGSREQATNGQIPTTLPIDCATLINKALEMSNQGCQQVGRDQFCYGHNTIEAKLAPGSNTSFDQPGSTIPINLLESFITAPLDTRNGDWGVGVFRLEANLPGTLPGQLVTILVFGNTSLENATGNMQAVYFTSGLGGIQCGDAPFNGLMVRMPDGAGFVFKVNGTDVSLQGTSVLDAHANGSLDVTMLDGTGTVGAFGQEQTIGPGQKVSVPLDGKDAGGPPGTPESVDPGIICALTGQNCPSTVAQVSTNTSVPIDPSRPTNTPVPVLPGQPTNTSVPLSTNTPAPAATHTSDPGATSTSTPASGLPTQTPKPGSTTQAPAATTQSPVATTQAPTVTTPPPTVTTPPPTVTTPPPTTEVPPTATTPPPTVDTCSTLNLVWNAAGKNFQISITNNASSSISMERTVITWQPSVNGALENIALQGEIWAGSEPGPSADLTFSTPPTIAAGSTNMLTIRFATKASGTNTIALYFSGGCTKNYP